MEVVRLESLTEYKRNIKKWVHDKILAATWNENKRFNIRHILVLAETGYYEAPFLLQDEDSRNFNRDVANECRRLLNA